MALRLARLVTLWCVLAAPSLCLVALLSMYANPLLLGRGSVPTPGQAGRTLVAYVSEVYPLVVVVIAGWAVVATLLPRLDSGWLVSSALLLLWTFAVAAAAQTLAMGRFDPAVLSHPLLLLSAALVGIALLAARVAAPPLRPGRFAAGVRAKGDAP